MAIASCTSCKNLFNKTIKDICSNCVIKEEEDYKKVRMYLKRHHTGDMMKVSEDTKVDIDLIYQFLQEGRINLSKEKVINYPCRNCETMIKTGALCETCETDLNDVHHSLQEASKTSVEPSKELTNKAKSAFHVRHI